MRAFVPSVGGPRAVGEYRIVAHAEHCTMADFVAQAIRELVTRIEERRGQPYPPHPEAMPKAPSTL